MTKARRIVLMLWDGGGVVPPEMELAGELIKAGHDVCVLGDPTIEAEACAAGCSFRPWTSAPHRTTRDRSADILTDYAAKSRRTYLKETLGGYLYQPGLEWTADALAAIDAHRADLVLSDCMIPWGVLAAEVRALPSAALFTMPYMVPTPGMRPSGAAMLRVPGPLEGARDAMLRWLFEKVFDGFVPHVNRVRTHHGLTPVAHTFDQLRKAKAKIVFTSRVFDHGGQGAPNDVHWIGPRLGDPTWCAPWTSPWPADDQRPLVLVGMSSTFQNHVELLRRLVEVLASLPVRGLVTLGPTVRVDEVPARGDVAVVPSVPHAQVLPSTSVLVTHAGHGTTIKGLAAGVPMLCLPLGRDQNDNAARVAALGAGLSLSPKSSTDELRAALRRLLEQPAFRDAARHAAAAIGRREGERNATEIVASL